MASEELHLDRERAEIFGAIAGQYDRYRPEYPAAMFDDLTASRPSVLDVGCGTGKVAAEFVRRGLPVLGVEPDPQMAAVARSHGVDVEIAKLEDWASDGRQFDLVTFGASWHWVDPARGVPKLASVLRTGGTLARFWTFHELSASDRAVLDEVYSAFGPGVHAHATAPDTPGAYVDPIASHPAFGPVEFREYRWDEEYSADDWLGMVETFSDHQRLGPRLPALLDALRAAIDGLGGKLHTRAGTFALVAQKDS